MSYAGCVLGMEFMEGQVTGPNSFSIGAWEGRLLLALLDLCLGPPSAPLPASLLWFFKEEVEISVPIVSGQRQERSLEGIEQFEQAMKYS